MCLPCRQHERAREREHISTHPREDDGQLRKAEVIADLKPDLPHPIHWDGRADLPSGPDTVRLPDPLGWAGRAVLVWRLTELDVVEMQLSSATAIMGAHLAVLGFDRPVLVNQDMAVEHTETARLIVLPFLWDIMHASGDDHAELLRQGLQPESVRVVREREGELATLLGRLNNEVGCLGQETCLG